MLLRKGIYPYEYMDSWEKFNQTVLPLKKILVMRIIYMHKKYVMRLK